VWKLDGKGEQYRESGHHGLYIMHIGMYQKCGGNDYKMAGRCCKIVGMSVI